MAFYLDFILLTVVVTPVHNQMSHIREKVAVAGAWYANKGRLNMEGIKGDAVLWCA